MKYAIVTGASGFIGQALCRRLLREGVYVFAVVRNKDKVLDLTSEGLSIIELNMDTYDRIKYFLGKKQIDYVFHLAWDGVYGKNFKDVTIQTENISNSVKFLKSLGNIDVGKFIFFSSSHIARVSRVDRSVIECIYGVSKFSFQNIAKTFCHINGISYNSIIFTNVFGVGDYSSRSTNLIIHKMLSNESLKLIDFDIKYDWIYIEDAIEGVCAVAERGLNSKEYYIGNKKIREFGDIIQDVKLISESSSELLFGKYKEDSYIDYEKFDIDSLYRDTGFVVKTDFFDALRKTIEWRKNILVRS